MSFSCPQCGAVYPLDETCLDRFNLSQSMELDDPAYYAVHHLSVPCYMLQHNAYSREGWLEVRALLSKFVHEGWTPDMARRQIWVNMGSGQRSWSITGGPKLPGVETIVWSFSLADIRLDTAETYCADVRRWAERILADTQQLLGQERV